MAGKFVDVTLRLIDKMTGPLNNAGNALANHAKQFNRAGWSIQKAGRSISKVGSSLTKSVTVPIVGAGAAAVKLAAGFEQGMSKVESISGATGGQLDKLSKKAKEMGAKTKFSATEATEAYQYMAMAGWKTKDMLNGIKPVMELAGASGEKLATTSDILTDSLTAFGKSAKDATKFADVMAAVSSNANTNVSMMGESFKYCAPVAGALGYSMEDTSKAIGLMANSGIKASNAGTALRSWMSRMAAPTDAVQSAMKKLGLSLTDSKGQMKDFDTIMIETKKAFAGLNEEQKSQYASIIAGKTGMSGMLAVVNSSDKDFNKLTNAVNKSNKACHDMYITANDNLNGQLTILKSTVESIGISFGEKLTPYVTKTVKLIQNAADKFNSLSGAQQDTIIKIGMTAAAVGPALLVFGSMVTKVGGVVKAFGEVGKVFKRFGSISAIIASPAGIVIGVMAALAVAAFVVIKNWDKIKPVIDKVVKSIQPAINTFKVMASTISKAFAPVAKIFKRDFGNAISESLGMVSKEVGGSKGAIQSFANFVNSAAKVISSVVVSVAKGIVPVLKSIIPVIAKMIPKAVNIAIQVVTIISKLVKAFIPIVKACIPPIKQVVIAIGGALAKTIKAVMPVIQKLGDVFFSVLKIVLKSVSRHVTMIGNVIKLLTPVFTTAFSTVGDVISVFADYIGNMFDSYCRIIGGVIDFVKDVFAGNWKKAWEDVKNIFKGVFDGLVNVVKLPLNLIISQINGAIKGLNKISLPDWVPKIGGKGINIPLIPKLAKGTDNWKGGIVQVHEKGGEIIDLPNGSRVYPHDESVKKAYQDGERSRDRFVRKEQPKDIKPVTGRTKVEINIPKIADQIIVREDADIDKIVKKLADRLEKVSLNVGGGEIGYLY